MTLRRTLAPLLTLLVLLSALVPAQAQTTSFRLGLPNEATLKRNLASDLPSFNWTPLTAATSYTLYVFKISNNTRADIGDDLTISVPTANCSADNCVYALTAPDFAFFTLGEYAWTVEAATSGGTIEAANGPRYFSYNPNPIQFISNGGFETGKIAPWKTQKLSADVVLVDGAQSNSGIVSWFFKGSAIEDSSINQLVDVTYYGIDASDIVTLSFAYKASGPSVNSTVRVNVKYTDGTGGKEKKLLTVADNYVVVTEVIELAKPVASFKVTLLNKSLKAKDKVYIDDVSLILSGSVVRESAFPFPTR